ncbi:MAG TPA: hypothetical protein DDW27_17285 [Bacteroidales bacterium]|nr:hypothetical protein [Bacteroidales bacterium]
MKIKEYKTGKFIIPVLIFILTACGKNILYTDSVTIAGKTWEITDIPEFTFNSVDTISKTNIFFNIRTGSDFPFRNIFLFVTAISPDGRSITDTLEYELADEKGNWYGKGIGDIHELNLPYRTDVFFPLKGDYIFKIQHGMRTTDLKGVYDFGIRIERL